MAFQFSGRSKTEWTLLKDGLAYHPMGEPVWPRFPIFFCSVWSSSCSCVEKFFGLFCAYAAGELSNADNFTGELASDPNGAAKGGRRVRLELMSVAPIPHCVSAD